MTDDPRAIPAPGCRFESRSSEDLTGSTGSTANTFHFLHGEELGLPDRPGRNTPAEAADHDRQDDIGRRFTQPLAQELGVRVNPRYGVWDPLRLAVLAPGTPAGLVLPATLS